MTMEQVTWDDAVEAFLTHRRANGVRTRTVEGYAWFLASAKASALRQALNIKGPADVTAVRFEQLMGELFGAGLRPQSVLGWFRVWHNFLAFCQVRGWLRDAAVLNVKKPRVPKQDVDVFSTEDEQKLVAAATCSRDRLMLRVALEAGLRRGELVGLCVPDIERSGETFALRVREGKGGKSRMVPISTDLYHELRRYVDEERPVASSEAMFVTTKRDGDGEYAPLTYDGLYGIWNRLSKATGIHAFPHKARHTFGTRLAADGLSPYVVREALGHETMAATDRYVRRSAIDLQRAFAGRASTRQQPPPPPEAGDAQPRSAFRPHPVALTPAVAHPEFLPAFLLADFETEEWRTLCKGLVSLLLAVCERCTEPPRGLTRTRGGALLDG